MEIRKIYQSELKKSTRPDPPKITVTTTVINGIIIFLTSTIIPCLPKLFWNYCIKRINLSIDTMKNLQLDLNISH